MNWRELADVQRRAMSVLSSTENLPRPACGRAYYAAYALVAHRLEPLKIAYAHGWRNPAHADLPRYVDQIAGLGPVRRKAVRTALRRLRQRREDTDYRPAVTVDRRTLRESLRDAAEVFRILDGVA